MKSVYVTVPNDKGWIHKHVHFSLCRILSDQRYKVRHDCPTHKPYVHNLHKCMWDFLDHDEDYWLTMDADNPPVLNPLDLISLNLDIIGFPTPVWHNAVPGDQPYYFNALKIKEDGYTPHVNCDGLQEVDAVGSGCMLLSRKVMEALKSEKPFMRTWNDQGLAEVSGDFSFCRKAKAAGFKIYTHYDYHCLHFNEIELTEIIHAFYNMKPLPEA